MAIIDPRFFKKALNDKFFSILFFSSLTLNILLWVFVLWQIKPQTEPVYLHYSIYFGIDLIGAYWRLYAIPLSGLIIFLLNGLFSVIIYDKEKIISYFLLVTNALVQIVLWVAAVLIISINI